MDSPPTTEQGEVRRRGRQRLIGAIALVAVLVVFVPMLLDSEPRPQRESPALNIPSKTNAPPLPAPPVAAAKAGAQSPTSDPGTLPRTPPKVAEAKVLEPSKPPPPKAAPPAGVAPVAPAKAGAPS